MVTANCCVPPRVTVGACGVKRTCDTVEALTKIVVLFVADELLALRKFSVAVPAVLSWMPRFVLLAEPLLGITAWASSLDKL